MGLQLFRIVIFTKTTPSLVFKVLLLKQAAFYAFVLTVVNMVCVSNVNWCDLKLRLIFIAAFA